MVMEMTDRSVPSSIGAEADVVGQRLSLRIGKTDCPGMVIAYFPKTQKHRIRFDCESGREKNFRLETMTYKWVTDRSKSSLPAYDLAIRRDAVGRRLEIFHQVRQKWYRATVLRYVEHCQHHALLLEPQGKVHLVDLTEQAWRFTDLIGAPQQPQTPLDATLPPSSLATSKYMGVLRFTESTWKACYEPQQLYIGCFGSEKDAALAYDVYARKRGSPVNFEDRRICRKGIKSLLVPEPKVVPEVTSSTPDVVVPAATTPEDAESTHTDAPPLLEDKHSVEESDATPSLEVEETESTPYQVQKVVVEEEVVSAAVPSEAKALKEKGEKKKEKTSKVKKEVSKARKEKVVVEEKAEVTDDDHPVIDMTASEDLPERPDLVVRRRISVEDDDDEEEEPVRRISVEEPRLPSAKEAATAIQEDSEFEFGDGEEEEEEEEESEESSDEEDVIVRPRKRGRPKKKQREKAEPESEESSDEREVKIPRKRGRPKKKHQKKASESEESSDEEELTVPRKRGRPKKKKHTKEALANLFDSSEDEEEELERRIARKLKKKGRSALLEELADHNTPPLGEQSEKKKKKRRKEKLTKRGRSILPVGTRFLKEFPDFGTFEGRITEWDGNHYFVYYSEDEDQEELSDYEFDNYEILSVPKKDALMDVSIRKSKKKKKRRREQDLSRGMN